MPPLTSPEQITNLPSGMGSMASTDPSQVLVKFSLFPPVSPEKVVDLETRNLLAGILAKEDLQPLREIVHADRNRM